MRFELTQDEIDVDLTSRPTAGDDIVENVDICIDSLDDEKTSTSSESEL